MSAAVPEPDVDGPVAGRQFVGRRKVRLGDVTADGRLRFDALTRYTQDVSDDDTTDAELGTELSWVVRRTSIAVTAPARLAETITITTFCSGLGRRWAERRLQVRGDAGAHYDVDTLWICVDPDQGRPAQLSDQFLEIYGPAAAGRTVTARLRHPKPPAEAVGEPWPLRVVDIDVFDHVNNAAYWAVVEESLAATPLELPFRATVEYSAGLELGQSVSVATHWEGDDRCYLWWLAGDDGSPAASALLEPLDETGSLVGEVPADS